MSRVSYFLGAALLSLSLAGCSAQDQDDTIVLGAVLSLSGKYSTNGMHAQNGYDFAVSRVNAMGGVNVGGKSYKLKIVYYDDESNPVVGAQRAERLIANDGIDFMLGPYSSGITRAIAPVTERFKVPMVEAEGASRSLFMQGFRYLFAVLSISDQYMSSAIDLAAETMDSQGRNASDVRVALAFEGDPFSQDVRTGVVNRARKFGMRIVVDEKVPRDLSDMTAILEKIRKVKPDLLMISAHTKGAKTAARQLAEMKIDVPMVAITHCEAGRLQEKPGTEGFICPTQWTETLRYTGKYFGSASDYEKLFKRTHSGYRRVPYQTAGASAAVLVWKEAFERANSFDKDKIRDAIAATDMMTFYGRIKFAPAGYNVAKPMVQRQIRDRRYAVVAPTEWAPHKVVYPRSAPR